MACGTLGNTCFGVYLVEQEEEPVLGKDTLAGLELTHGSYSWKHWGVAPGSAGKNDAAETFEYCCIDGGDDGDGGGGH